MSWAADYARNLLQAERETNRRNGFAEPANEFTAVQAGTGGAGIATPLLPVQVVGDGGNAGNATTECSFTYSIWPVDVTRTDENRLATKLTPARRRTRFGLYLVAGDGTEGLARKKNDGTYVLLDAFAERPAITGCDCP